MAGDNTGCRVHFPVAQRVLQRQGARACKRAWAQRAGKNEGNATVALPRPARSSMLAGRPGGAPHERMGDPTGDLPGGSCIISRDTPDQRWENARGAQVGPQRKQHPWQDSNLQPPDPWSGALPLSHTDTCCLRAFHHATGPRLRPPAQRTRARKRALAQRARGRVSSVEAAVTGKK